MGSRLKDPFSAQYNFLSGPEQQWSSFFGSIKFGYGVCVTINAKNSYGGYTGQKLHYFLIHNSNIVQHFYQSGRGDDIDIKGIAAEKRCS